NISYVHKSLSSSSPAHTPKEEYIIAKSEDSGEIVGNHTEQPQSLEDVVKSSATEPSPGPEHAGKEENLLPFGIIKVCSCVRLSTQDALQQRMSVQEDSVLQLKQELLRSSMAREELEGQNVELERKLSERNRLLSECKQQSKLDDCSTLTIPNCLLQLSGCENNGYSHMMDTSSAVFQHRMVSHGDELQLVRDALRSLRDNFSGHDPQHHTLDTLEQGVSSLVDRLHNTENKKRQERKGSTRSPGRKANHTDRESWPSSSTMAHSHSSPVLSAAASTKVLYYTDRSLTPFLVNIPKRLGEVTLQDFKAAVDRHGSFRYHFKSLDPEFGTVKEEVFQDDAVIPGWEGKIVAWVEEDHGEGR
uniref:Dixin-A-like n=1 Tax=Sinocyclocheilus grahami TaxID=75366 RepID=A0A672K7K8_SINGR